MTLWFFPAPLLIYSATPLTYSAKAVMATTVTMAAAPYNGFDYAAIFNNNALIIYCGQRCSIG